MISVFWVSSMGCVASKLDINDVHPNMFAVNNVDDMGVKLNSGQLEITEVELVLHRRGKQPVKWPLRYGFEEGLFSFEAGRKNPTGPGIYSFKCRRAENLFNLLQIRVRDQVPSSDTVSGVRTQVGNQDVVQANSSPIGEESQTPRAQTIFPHPRTSVSGISASSQPSEDAGIPTLGSTYINVAIPVSSPPPPRLPPLHPGSDLPSESSTTMEQPITSGNEMKEEDESESHGHAYENVGPLQSPGGYLPPSHLFVLPPKPTFRQKIPSTTSDTSEQLDIGPSPPESPCCITETSINYIVLDLDNSVPPPTTPTYKADNAKTTTTGPKGAGYVTIDFDKTDALIKSANQRFFEDDDPGVRKTRHNSSLSDLKQTNT